jgi:hypothetical protein
LLSVREPVPVGAGVSLEVRPTSGSPLDLHGEVVRVVPSGEPGSYDVGVRVQGNGARTLLMLDRPGNA